jgi:hypothetical protein
MPATVGAPGTRDVVRVRVGITVREGRWVAELVREDGSSAVLAKVR